MNTETQQTQTPPQGGDLLEWVVGQYLGQKIQAKNILNYNGANMAFNHARDIAQKLDLDPNKITPFPANSTSINVAVPERITTSTGLKPWQQAAIAGMLLTTGALAATVIPPLFNNLSTPTPVTEPHTPTTGSVDIDVR